jgi:hypothetical protein
MGSAPTSAPVPGHGNLRHMSRDPLIAGVVTSNHACLHWFGQAGAREPGYSAVRAGHGFRGPERRRPYGRCPKIRTILTNLRPGRPRHARFIVCTDRILSTALGRR